MTDTVTTYILVLSDTLGFDLKYKPTIAVDVIIFCGNMTNNSTLREYLASMRMMQSFDAPVRLAIPGNHDWLSEGKELFKEMGSDNSHKPIFREFLHANCCDEAIRKCTTVEMALPIIRRRLSPTTLPGLTYLRTGSHIVKLANGATVKVFASPWTPIAAPRDRVQGRTAFQYEESNTPSWKMDDDTDIVITHGPPRGILDDAAILKNRRPAEGCPALFSAVSKCRPKLHCFGHARAGWGAELVTWWHPGGEALPARVSHPRHITQQCERKRVVDINILRYEVSHDGEIDEADQAELKMQSEIDKDRCCSLDVPITGESQTMFVNASIKGSEMHSDWDPERCPFLITLQLPSTKEERPEVKTGVWKSRFCTENFNPSQMRCCSRPTPR